MYLKLAGAAVFVVEVVVGMSKSNNKLPVPLILLSFEAKSPLDVFAEKPELETGCKLKAGLTGAAEPPAFPGGGGNRIPPAPKPDGFCLDALDVDVSDFF